MHDTSIENARKFVSTYVNKYEKKILIDIGSQAVDGNFSIRQMIPENVKYIGVDFQVGQNVDVVLTDPYTLPFEYNSIDYVISSSCFEHSEFFWLSFSEIMRVLKPGGLFYLNAPSNGAFHRYPVDCWRFYPDSAVALSKWGRRNGYDCEVLEQFTSLRQNDIWFDYVAVFIKGKEYIKNFDNRIINNISRYMNGSVFPNLEEYRNKVDIINISPNPF